MLQHAHNPVNWFPGWKLLKSSNATTSASSYLFNTVLVIDLHVHVIDGMFA
ncbi:thioredoxin domain-containing protein [Paenibacillus odorifer]|uniref:thioredoxin domain-containing protein n=1 Tax=Paenibacillus odorifer TaxID=189426 RepID=UPI0020C988ED|nr:thioredoxin domain-containing protein [Paenibacillus odorifer]